MCYRQKAVAWQVRVTFGVDPDVPPRNAAIHDALRALRALELDAPTLELAEHHAQVIVSALERAGS